MKKISLIAFVMVISLVLTAAGENKELEHLNLNSFKEKVFDYENNAEWKYLGDLPAIIDFYADWCGPCKQVAPIMVELAEEYEGKLVIYKINTDEQRELAGMFGIRSIPSILFIPVDGQPQMATGALPKSEFVKMINEILKVG
ncbi:MAG: thioredoxin [Candidatus Cloacimonadales bacterium]|nr:thioredoxin [Candidatus Cloacimonadales bacterium]